MSKLWLTAMAWLSSSASAVPWYYAIYRSIWNVLSWTFDGIIQMIKIPHAWVAVAVAVFVGFTAGHHEGRKPVSRLSAALAHQRVELRQAEDARDAALKRVAALEKSNFDLAAAAKPPVSAVTPVAAKPARALVKKSPPKPAPKPAGGGILGLFGNT